jgi:UPF0716 family protein affecting phage T7 exclusion
MSFLKWIPVSLLLLPVMELATFIAVAVAIGFATALGLIVLGSICGMMLLRHGGGGHVARIRTAVNGRSFSALQTDAPGGVVLLAGILLLIPGFITDAIALVLLLFPALRRAAETLGLRQPPPCRSPDGVLDLEPEQWHQVPDPRLPHDRERP